MICFKTTSPFYDKFRYVRKWGALKSKRRGFDGFTMTWSNFSSITSKEKYFSSYQNLSQGETNIKKHLELTMT